MRGADRKKVIILEMKCLRSLVGVSRIDRVRMKHCVRELESGCIEYRKLDSTARWRQIVTS